MNWRYKAFLQMVLSQLPAGHELNYLFRRYVTKTVPASRTVQAKDYSFAVQHLSRFREHGSVPIEDAFFYEFGVGWDLTIPLSFYALGVTNQIVTDVRRLAKTSLIANTTEVLPTLKLEPTLPRSVPVLPRGVRGRHLSRVLKEYYGIDYRAPFDARSTGFASGSTDYITATKVLSYIPVDVLRNILAECRRILRPGGMMSVLMDYRDEYSYFDSNISVYNLLRYSDRSWELLYNPLLNYQNRLRHSDYKSLFATAGFEIVSDEPGYDGTIEDAQEVLDRVPLAQRFKSYDSDDLAAVRGVFLLRKIHEERVVADSEEPDRQTALASSLLTTSDH